MSASQTIYPVDSHVIPISLHYSLDLPNNNITLALLGPYLSFSSHDYPFILLENMCFRLSFWLCGFIELYCLLNRSVAINGF